jgi:hypothetical protein
VQILLTLNALTWIALGVLGIFYLPADQTSATLAYILVGLIFLNALLLGLVAWGVGRGIRWLYWMGMALVGFNLFLSVTDQLGLIDLIILGLNALTLGLMFRLRLRFGVRW